MRRAGCERFLWDQRLLAGRHRARGASLRGLILCLDILPSTPSLRSLFSGVLPAPSHKF